MEDDVFDGTIGEDDQESPRIKVSFKAVPADEVSDENTRNEKPSKDELTKAQYEFLMKDEKVSEQSSSKTTNDKPEMFRAE